jgi:hypothetical protein
MMKPYSDKEYEEAKKQGLNLDNWNDFCKYFGLKKESHNTNR